MYDIYSILVKILLHDNFYCYDNSVQLVIFQVVAQIHSFETNLFEIIHNKVT